MVHHASRRGIAACLFRGGCLFVLIVPAVAQFSSCVSRQAGGEARVGPARGPSLPSQVDAPTPCGRAIGRESRRCSGERGLDNSDDDVR